MPKNAPKDTHKARKPEFPKLELQKIFFWKLIRFFSGKSHSAEKGTFSIETTFLKPETDRETGAYFLIEWKFRKKRTESKQPKEW